MTSAVDPVLAVSAMQGADVTSFDEARAEQALVEVRTLRGLIDRYEASVTSQLQRLHQRGAAAPAADLHTRTGGVSAKEANRKERRAKALDEAPTVAEALASGKIGAEHADALANATTVLDDDVKASFFALESDLAADATRMTPEQFAQSCRDLARRLERDQGVERAEQQRRQTRLSKKIDREGMYVLTARMHPELGGAVFNSIDAEVAAMVKAGGDRTVDRQHVAALALGNLTTGGHQAVRPTEAEIRVHVDVASLVDGPHEGTICELDDGSPVPPPSVRRMVCNGRIVPIMIGRGGVALDVGRTQRLANRAQRRALRAMYRTCAFHGCDVGFDRCEIHHIHEWELGGPTDLHNLIPLCSRHHHLAHEGKWRLHLDPDRTLTIQRPGGSIHATVPLEFVQRAGRRDDGPSPHRRKPQDDASSDHVQPTLLSA